MGRSHDLRTRLAALEASGLRRRLRSVQGSPGRLIQLEGREVLNFSSNNYLALADHPRLVAAAQRAMEAEGMGTGASRLILGNHACHEALERALAGFHHRPAALLFNSGYNANVGVLQALCEPGDVIFSDELNHASIIDGCRLSRAEVVVYPHGGVDELRRLIQRHGHGRRWVVTDTVFSMDGDRAPLQDLGRLCEEMDASLVVDEAHATGVLGPDGRGAAAAAGVEPEVQIGTLSKGFGCFGAYVLGSDALVAFLLNRARSFVFTTALPVAIVGAAHEALHMIQAQEGLARRTRLGQLIEQFASGLQALGLLAPGAGTTPIFPVLVGDDRKTMDCCERLLSQGIYAQGIRPPTVPRGTSRLRFALMASHTDGDIQRALTALAGLMHAGMLEPQPAGTSRTRETTP